MGKRDREAKEANERCLIKSVTSVSRGGTLVHCEAHTSEFSHHGVRELGHVYTTLYPSLDEAASGGVNSRYS